LIRNGGQIEKIRCRSCSDFDGGRRIAGRAAKNPVIRRAANRVPVQPDLVKIISVRSADAGRRGKRAGLSADDRRKKLAATKKKKKTNTTRSFTRCIAFSSSGLKLWELLLV
jgi:hypothetical protein